VVTSQDFYKSGGVNKIKAEENMIRRQNKNFLAQDAIEQYQK
jgi:hypothetical protein